MDDSNLARTLLGIPSTEQLKTIIKACQTEDRVT